MRSSRKLPLLLVCIALAAGGVAAKKSDKKDDASRDKKDDKRREKTAAATPSPGATPAGPARISLPLDAGHPSRGLKIPYYEADGRLQMMFNIGQADRLDEDRVKMQELLVDMYNEEGEPDMSIDLPTSIFNLATHVITSQTKTTIRRDDFTIVGDAVEFDTLSKQGKLVGNVHMTIFNIKAAAAGPQNPALAPTPLPAEAPTRARALVPTPLPR